MKRILTRRRERQLRLGTGLVLTAFISMHLGNHTFGLLSIEAMDNARRLTAVWQHPALMTALYGSFFAHFVLALRSLYLRSTLRMPAWEFAQLAFGLAIPFMLAGHVAATRLSQTLLGIDVDYTYVVSGIWLSDWLRIKQPLLIVIAWVHVVVGLHFWLRMYAWYRPMLPILYALAILLPIFSILGFVRAGLEIEPTLLDPAARAAIFAGWYSAPKETIALVEAAARWAPWVLAGMLGGVLAARQWRVARAARSAHFQIHHPAAGAVGAFVGHTVLEALRAAQIPHASVCGGRARCTTCRVHVDRGSEHLDPPGETEATALVRVGGTDKVRLACQIRPRADLWITPLVAVGVDPGEIRRPGGISGREQPIVSMFVDLRESTKLGESRLPFDVVFVLNLFFAEMSAALDETGGHYAQFAGDGLLALYGIEGGLGPGSRDALRGAAVMSERIAALNERLEGELAEPLRIGIGIHGGDAIVGTMGPPSSPLLSAIGDNVNIAARLEAKTKEYGCTLVISEETARHAGADLSAFPVHEAQVRGRTGLITVFAVDDPRAFELAGVARATRDHG